MKQDDNDNLFGKTKLKWACRRGMLELDVLLGNFLESSYDSLSLEDKILFQRLLSCTDPELFAWLMGHVTPEDRDFLKIVTVIRNHAKHRI